MLFMDAYYTFMRMMYAFVVIIDYYPLIIITCERCLEKGKILPVTEMINYVSIRLLRITL